MKISLIRTVETGIIIGAMMLTNLACQATEGKEYDLVVYGQTSAGVIAAVQAKRMDKTVIVVGPDEHLGGLSSGGLGATDIGNKKAIGMGAYTMDSHHVQRYVDDNGHVRNEGDVQVGKFEPYPIGYGSIVPKRGECANLLVPVCLSATHIAFGSIRMEPVFMVLGQSAATAAPHAIDASVASVAVQDVDYKKLRERLLADKQVLQN